MGQFDTKQTSTTDMAWSSKARCRGLDAEIFFVRSLQQAKDAIKVCQRCPVRQDCLDFAVDEGIEVGVWGGLTERQRRAYGRRREADRHPGATAVTP